jgi:serine/threonine-protein kinase
MPFVRGSSIGPYEIVAQIGAGGMGEVYRARDTTLQRDVALKILPERFARDDDRLMRFAREARMLAALNHAHIAQIYGVQELADTRALVMELVEGPTLAECMAAGPLPLHQTLAIARQIADALDAAHEKGIVHRDLKPANIKVRPDGTVKVLDFGLAKGLGASDTNGLPDYSTVTITTRAGAILGTAAYMSPEQARGLPVDKRTDIWGFGAVLYEMLTGRMAFGGATLSDTLARILERDPEYGSLPDSTPSNVRRVLLRCLQKDPRRRLRDIGDARIELEDAAAPDPQRLAAGAGGGLWMWATALLLILLAGGILARGLQRPHAPSVTRFSEVLPEGRSYSSPGFPIVAVSPNGKAIVYVANDQLHVRSLDGFESRALPAIEGTPSTPFFSPDGQSIAYVIGDQARTRLRLERIAAAGGTPVKLADVTSFFGASWVADGTILFGQTDGIWKVSANGGVPERLIAIEPHERVAAPQMLPGGRDVLFTLTDGVGEARWDEDARIVVQSLDTGERQIVWTGGSHARYAPTGHLVFALRSVLFALRFDVATRRVTGPPIPVLESVNRGVLFPGSMGAAHYDFSNEGLLVYVPGTPAPIAKRRLLAVNREGKTQPLLDELRDYWRPRLSPDGGRLAIEVRDEAGVHIWIVDLVKKSARPLTFEGKDNWSPVWSPDGASVIFNSDRGGFFGFYSQPVDASGAARLIWRSNLELVPTDASRLGILAFSAGGQTAERAIWTLRLEDDSATEFLATPAMEHMAMFSPDGRWLAYASNESGRPEVYMRPYPKIEGSVRRISEGGGTAPVWSPDGSTLYYIDLAGVLTAADIRHDPFSVQRRSLFKFWGRFRISGNTSAYDVSRDGTRFIVVSQPENVQTLPPRMNVVLNWFQELRRVTSDE